LIPLLRDSAYLNQTVWETPTKADSFGARTVLGWLLNGSLLDYHRFPSLTILAGFGAAVCLLRWRQPLYRMPLALGSLWLLAYFGRPTWGFILDLIPLSHSLQLHRLINGVHLAAILLAAIGLAAPREWAF